MSDIEEIQIKSVVLGDPGVGKTSLRRSFIGESFNNNYLQTIGSDFSYKTVTVDNQSIGLAIWDLAGQPEFRSVHSLFYRGSMAVVLVYEITNRDSFNNLTNWLNEYILKTGVNNLPLLIIGNKIDLEDTSVEFITSEEQEQFIIELKENPRYDFLISSIRTSAKTGVNVEIGIMDFSKMIIDWLNKDLKKQSFTKYAISEKLIDNFPFAYIIAMNQAGGPQILATSGVSGYSDSQIQASGIYLMSSFTFEEIISNVSLTGSYDSPEFNEIIYYNAFIIENEKARGNTELFIIVLHHSKNLLDPISKLKGMIDGFMNHTMNGFQRIRISNKIDFVTAVYKPVDHPNITKEISNLLDELRKKLHVSMKNWLNI